MLLAVGTAIFLVLLLHCWWAEIAEIIAPAVAATVFVVGAAAINVHMCCLFFSLSLYLGVEPRVWVPVVSRVSGRPQLDHGDVGTRLKFGFKNPISTSSKKKYFSYLMRPASCRSPCRPRCPNGTCAFWGGKFLQIYETKKRSFLFAPNSPSVTRRKYGFFLSLCRDLAVLCVSVIGHCVAAGHGVALSRAFEQSPDDKMHYFNSTFWVK